MRRGIIVRAAPVRVAAAFALATVGAPALLAGQAPAAPVAPIVAAGDGARLRGGRLEYALQAASDSGAVPLGTRVLEIVAVSYGGGAAWVLSESRAGTAVTTSDSLYVTQGDLLPLRWVASAGPARMAIEFGADSGRGLATGPSGRVPYSLPSRPGLVVTAGMAEALLRVAPLRTGWEASGELVIADLSGARVVAVRLAVEGEERVRVPAGEFDSWVVAMRGDGIEHRWWVRRDGTAVKSAYLLPGPRLAVVEAVLTVVR